MKKFVLASLAGLALASGPALAADMALKAPPPPPPPPGWTGCYVDAGVGYGLWNQDHFTETDPGRVPESSTTTTGGRGWLGRIGAGCDIQFPVGGLGNWVVGLLGDYDFSNIHGTFQDSFIGFGGDEKLTHQWHAGARLGYVVVPQLLTYVSGGYTEARFGQVDFLTLFAPVAAPVGLNIGAHTYHGWWLGGGEEYAFTWLPIPGLFWRTEYRFSQFSTADLPIVVTATGAPFGSAENMKKYEQTVTSSLVWRFNWGGAWH